MKSYPDNSSFVSLIKLVFVFSIVVLLSSCLSTVGISEMKSSNYSFRVKTLVMHFTAVNYEDSVKYLVSDGGGVSSHYLIPMQNDDTYPYSSIKVLKLVDENERAWHAGVSHWQGRDGLNDTSIGIEIVNVPECIEQQTPAGFMKPRPVCIFPEFENKQIDLLIELSKGILERNPDITPTAVVGHSDIAPSRKNDPGPRFPWQKLYEAGIGAWYENDAVAKYWTIFNQKPISIGLVQKALSTYGYKVAVTGVFDRQTQDVLSAFQLHFVPWQIDGLANSQTVATLFALIEKYFPDQLVTLTDEYNAETIYETFPNFVNQTDLNVDLTAIGTNTLEQNKMVFLSNGIQSELSLTSIGIKNADIFINEQKVNLGDYFSINDKDELQIETFSIGKRTVQGVNSIRIENIELLAGYSADVTADFGQNEPNPDVQLLAVDEQVDANEYDTANDSNTEALANIELSLEKTPKLHISISYPTINELDAATVRDKSGLQYDFAKLDSWLKKRLEDQVNGASVVVIHRGNLVKHEVYGFAQKNNTDGELLENPIKMTKQTMFDVGHNTQVLVTTLAIMKLVDEGKLTLNETITHYLDEYRGSNREVVTIADLLLHSSGYQASVDFFDLNNPFGEFLYSLEPELTKQYLLTRVPFSNSKGNQVKSDFNFMILGVLVERVTGMALDDYVERHIYPPLGLRQTLFNPLRKGKSIEQFATVRQKNCYGDRENPLILAESCMRHGEVSNNNALYSMQGVSGHAGLFSSSSDLAVIAQMLLNTGGYGREYLFSQQTLSQFTRVSDLSSRLALGWKIAHHYRAGLFGPYASSNAYGHISDTGSAIIIDPDMELAIITFVNEQAPPTENRDSLLKFNPVQAKLSSMIYESIFEAQTHSH